MEDKRLHIIRTEIRKWNEEEAGYWTSSHITDGFVLSAYIRHPPKGCNLWHFCNDMSPDTPCGIDQDKQVCCGCGATVPTTVRLAYKLICLDV